MTFTLRGDDVCHLIHPTPILDPYWVCFSRSAAQALQLPLAANGLPEDGDWLKVLAGNQLETKDMQFSEPLATVYSGHQFGVWAGQLGDGRAILLGDIHGQELQLKGAGKTRYSRMGDGRAVLRSSIREFLCSEAMYHLGIPTSRALSIVGSKQTVLRESLETAAICARFAPSFIRIGHFEHFSSLNDIGHLKELADYLITNHYPKCFGTADPYLELFKAISSRNARLTASWQGVGFCHGVLNSDNISVLGLTVDYGPFGFLDQFQIDHICNHSDHAGRYAYHRQPQVMQWNIACLASAFLSLLELSHTPEEAQILLRQEIDQFSATYTKEWQHLFRSKLGLQTEYDEDIDLIERLLKMMHDSKVDFTNLFRSLSKIRKESNVSDIEIRNHFIDIAKIDHWLAEYLARLQLEELNDQSRAHFMNRVNPKYILRNHLAQSAIERAQLDDFSEVSKLLTILSNPYEEQTEYEVYALPPPEDLEAIVVSCSS